MEHEHQVPLARQSTRGASERTDENTVYSGFNLSLARRFVLTPGPTADGVLFYNGVVVLMPRRSPSLEIFHGGITELSEPFRSEIEWIDAPRPTAR